MFQESDTSNFRFISPIKDGSAGHQGSLFQVELLVLGESLKPKIKNQSLFIVIVFREYDKSLFQVD